MHAICCVGCATVCSVCNGISGLVYSAKVGGNIKKSSHLHSRGGQIVAVYSTVHIIVFCVVNVFAFLC